MSQTQSFEFLMAKFGFSLDLDLCGFREIRCQFQRSILLRKRDIQKDIFGFRNEALEFGSRFARGQK